MIGATHAVGASKACRKMTCAQKSEHAQRHAFLAGTEMALLLLRSRVQSQSTNDSPTLILMQVEGGPNWWNIFCSLSFAYHVRFSVLCGSCGLKPLTAVAQDPESQAWQSMEDVHKTNSGREVGERTNPNRKIH